MARLDRDGHSEDRIGGRGQEDSGPGKRPE